VKWCYEKAMKEYYDMRRLCYVVEWVIIEEEKLLCCEFCFCCV